MLVPRGRRDSILVLKQNGPCERWDVTSKMRVYTCTSGELPTVALRPSSRSYDIFISLQSGRRDKQTQKKDAWWGNFWYYLWRSRRTVWELSGLRSGETDMVICPGPSGRSSGREASHPRRWLGMVIYIIQVLQRIRRKPEQLAITN